ncbi:MAG TPA: glycosyltransferase [Pyrinomonadaceae bacterium]|nr:glycosyltransferase [Pyrinomonadaceae bacterium]
MKHICIGIHVHAEPERLRSTVNSVRAHTSGSFEILLLPDGPDAATTFALRAMPDLQQCGSSARGTAACFNRLAAYSNAEVVVLLESGAQVGPGWLDHLLVALDADPRNGLAGPTTNNSWNEQGVYSETSADQLVTTANRAAQQFDNEVRTLEPLYSLADFCYAVRREVIEAVGAADEDYGLGPCWEMDYNIRAARAGWRGVWACAAYVHRGPFTARRRLEEARRFELSKRRYQDKFCGARLRGEKSDYRSHCAGDACPNFAPAALIELQRPLSPPSTAVVEPAIIDTREPLASCIMPTHNRRSFVPQAIRSFLRQDYANVELVIVDDGTDPIVDLVPDDERLRYFRLAGKQNIGAKRNYACEQARGEFILHWDDDDWYPATRISRQMAALTSRGFDLCGTSRLYFFDPEKDQLWEYRYAGSGPKWVAGSTLAYRKSLWAQHPFPEIQIGEDSRFVWASAGRTIHDLADPSLCVATVHAGNTSAKVVGASWHPQSISQVNSLMGDDRYFYYRTDPAAQTTMPRVSCIMPTYNRRPFVRQTLDLFQRQDYPNRELIIVDDGSDAIEDLTEGLANVLYLRLSSRTSIGAKRNLACQHASGEVIAHWDDDDWYSSDRLRYQTVPILTGKADITGLDNGFVMELPSGEFWTINPKLHQQLFKGNVHGGTLVYRKDVWGRDLRYPNVNLAEDAYLLHHAMQRGKRLLRLANPGVFVYTRHGSNAWREFAPGRFLNPDGWERIARPHMFPAAMLASYTSAALGGK